MRTRLAISAILFLIVGSAWAHHSFSADFDAKRPVRLDGVVVGVDWSNPHAAIYVDVRGPDGDLVHWMVEAASPNALLRRGFTKTSLSAGMSVVIEGYQAKSGEHRASGQDVILPTGQKLLLRSNGTDAQ
jgi:hypothetical protein